jgi:hypothetical protein
MITKSISIRDDQQKWIVEKSINLSRFVQKHIDEAINYDKRS